jgi:hypothetical protein
VRFDRRGTGREASPLSPDDPIPLHVHHASWLSMKES